MSKIQNSKNGFTLIELLIVTAITAVLTTVVTVNFRQLRSSQAVNAAATDFISKIREVQSNLQTGKIVTGQAVPATAYQVVLTSNSASYRIDSDISGAINTLETVNMTTNVTVSQVYVNNAPVGSTTLRITAPYAQILTDGALDKTVKVDLLNTLTNDTRTVIIDGISGRIGLQ
jgi:prepilin-type N-terminal cleavage/methylation domain-containing protein